MRKIKTVTVKAEKKYKVFIGENLLKTCGEILRAEGLGGAARRILTVCDSNVAPLYFNTLKKSLERAGLKVCLFTFQAGEAQKTADTLQQIIDAAAQNGLDRHDLFAALGGGTVGDLCGLAASLYMRGVKYLQFPTTLLSSVDAAIGGKTACNTAFGKNLMGAFYSPDAVFADTATLNTLPSEIYSQGIAEAVKYGLISDRKIIEMLGGEFDNADLIYRCVKAKARFIKHDFTEKGERKILNFGHTAAHAIEKVSNYKISHGNAVAAGIITALKYSQKMGLCAQNLLPRILPVYQKFGLSERVDLPASDLVNAALCDKKSRGECVDLVLLKSLCRPKIVGVKKAQLKDFFEVDL